MDMVEVRRCTIEYDTQNLDSRGMKRGCMQPSEEDFRIASHFPIINMSLFGNKF